MDRFKVFNATGIATDGRLYAGDLLLMQDLVAALDDDTQALAVGSIQVGTEAGLSFTRYGSGEIGLAAKLRLTNQLTIASGDVLVKTNAGKLIFGASGDVNLYRSAANILKTDDSLTVDIDLTVNGAAVVGSDLHVTGEVYFGSSGVHFNDGTTQTSAASSAGNIPVGGVIDWPWASASIPANFGLPYSQSVLRASYPDLNTVAGSGSGAEIYPYGAADSTHMTMPDYRGVSASGKDNMGGSTRGKITAAISGTAGTVLGAVIGAEGITLTSAEMPAHTHVQNSHNHTQDAHTHVQNSHNHTQNAHSHAITPYADANAPSGPSSDGMGHAGSAWYGLNTDSTTATNIAATATNQNTTATNQATTATNQNTGGGGVHQNMHPTIIVNKIIRMS